MYIYIVENAYKVQVAYNRKAILLGCLCLLRLQNSKLFILSTKTKYILGINKKVVHVSREIMINHLYLFSIEINIFIVILFR